MIRFRCTCGKKIGVPDEWNGRHVKCSGCGRSVEVRQELPSAAVGLVKAKGASTKMAGAPTVKDAAAVEQVVAVPVPRTERCGNCDRVIGKLETCHVWGDHVVCADCHPILSRPAQIHVGLPKHGEPVGVQASTASSPPSPPTIIVQAPAPVVNLVNNNVNTSAIIAGAPPMQFGKRFSPTLAALLSLLLPGLGQLYEGRFLSGALWFVLTAAGYVFVVPGIVLHLCCIISAGARNPYR